MDTQYNNFCTLRKQIWKVTGTIAWAARIIVLLTSLFLTLPGLSVGHVEVGAFVVGPELRILVSNGGRERGLVINPLQVLAGRVGDH